MASKFNVILPAKSKNWFPFPNGGNLEDLVPMPSSVGGVLNYWANMRLERRTGIETKWDTWFTEDTIDYASKIMFTTDIWQEKGLSNSGNPEIRPYYETAPDKVLFGSQSWYLSNGSTTLPTHEFRIRFPLPKEQERDNDEFILSFYVKYADPPELYDSEEEEFLPYPENHISNPALWALSLRTWNTATNTWAENLGGLNIKINGNIPDESDEPLLANYSIGKDKWVRIAMKVNLGVISSETNKELALRIVETGFDLGGDAIGHQAILIDGFQLEQIDTAILDANGGKLRALYNSFNSSIHSPYYLLPLATTYFDGETGGCNWNGARNASTSSRTSGLGGYVLNLEDDMLFPVETMSGWGMTPIENIYSDLNHGGRQYRGTITKDSVLTLTSSFLQSAETFSSDGLLNLHQIRRRWIDFIAQVINMQSLGSNKFYILYTGAEEDKLLEVQYDSGMEGFNLDGIHEVKIPMKFVNASGTAEGIGYKIYPHSRKWDDSYETTGKDNFVYESLKDGLVILNKDGSYETIFDRTISKSSQILNIPSTSPYNTRGQIIFCSIIGEYNNAIIYQLGIYYEEPNTYDVFIVRYANRDDHYSLCRLQTNSTSSLTSYKVNDVQIIGNELFVAYNGSNIQLNEYTHPSANYTAVSAIANNYGKVYAINLDTFKISNAHFASNGILPSFGDTKAVDYDSKSNIYFLSRNSSGDHQITRYKDYDSKTGTPYTTTLSTVSTREDCNILGLKNNIDGGVFIYNMKWGGVTGCGYITTSGVLAGTNINLIFQYERETEDGDDSIVNGAILSVMEESDGSILVAGRFNRVAVAGSGTPTEYTVADSGLVRLIIGGGVEPMLLGDDRIDYITKLEKHGDDILVWYQPQITEPYLQSTTVRVRFDKSYHKNTLTSPFLLSAYSNPISGMFHQGWYPQSFFMSYRIDNTHVPTELLENGGATGTLLKLDSWKQSLQINDKTVIATTRIYKTTSLMPFSIGIVAYSENTKIGEVIPVYYEGTSSNSIKANFYFIEPEPLSAFLRTPMFSYIMNATTGKILPIDLHITNTRFISVDNDSDNLTPVMSSSNNSYEPNGYEYDVAYVPNNYGSDINKFRVLIFPLLRYDTIESPIDTTNKRTYFEFIVKNRYCSLD
jgi:hypothetical protein